MSWRRLPVRNLWQWTAWLVLVALLPWWLGLPLLLSMAGMALLLQARLHAVELQCLRRALRWGLAGFLLALVHALGGDALAWVIALLAALAGFTLIAGIEAWLDRALRRQPERSTDYSEWPELARAPVGPPAQIIELQLPNWDSLALGLADPQGGQLIFRNHSIHFADGSVVDDVDSLAGFSPDGEWFFARLRHRRGIVLWHRQHAREQRLQGWDLCGWHGGQPWVIRGHEGVPELLSGAGVE